jgi:aminoglycoside 6'-N-acetyltransferase
MTPDSTPPPAGHPLLARLPVHAGPVRLRALRAADIHDFQAYRSDPAVARFQGWQPMDRDAALAFLRHAAPPPFNVGDWAQIGIARTDNENDSDSDDDQLVGDIGLLREGLTQVQIGFSLARSAQGRGWAFAAVGACIDELLLPLGLTRLRGITDSRNAASLRLLSRLGFVQTSSEEQVFRGEPCTEITLERMA